VLRPYNRLTVHADGVIVISSKTRDLSFCSDAKKDFSPVARNETPETEYYWETRDGFLERASAFLRVRLAVKAGP